MRSLDRDAPEPPRFVTLRAARRRAPELTGGGDPPARWVDDDGAPLLDDGLLPDEALLPDSAVPAVPPAGLAG